MVAKSPSDLFRTFFSHAEYTFCPIILCRYNEKTYYDNVKSSTVIVLISAQCAVRLTFQNILKFR